MSVCCNGCRGLGAGPIGTPSVGPALKPEGMLSARGCLMCSTANATSDRSANRVSIFEMRIIFLDPNVSVSSRKTNAEPAARRANHNRPTEKERISCDTIAAERGTRLVGSAPCLVICDSSNVSKLSRLGRVGSGRKGRRTPRRRRSRRGKSSSRQTYHQQERIIHEHVREQDSNRDPKANVAVSRYPIAAQRMPGVCIVH